MKIVLSVLFAIACATGAYYFALEKGFVNPYPPVCDLVAQKIFLPDEPIKKWYRQCLRRARLVTPYSPKKLVIKDLNNMLGLLNVSHLEVFDSSQVRNIWRGENAETGIESEFMDSELVVFKVHPDSPAAKAGIRKGDVIESINDEQPNPWDASASSGRFTVSRKNQKLDFTLRVAPIRKFEGVEWEDFPHGSRVHIPSFRGNFFEEKEVRRIQEKLSTVKRLVVDLRGNNGGNFVAGLRFLSLFICEPQEIGKLQRPRYSRLPVEELKNDLDDLKQLAQLNQSSELKLVTYPNTDFCFKGEVQVLTNQKTASVAEMVAQALKEFRGARLLGAPSRGQMLVGVWYPLPEVGPGVEISIPEAVYRSREGRELEGRGVDLDKVLYYSLAEMQSGVDSWVRRALD